MTDQTLRKAARHLICGTLLLGTDHLRPETLQAMSRRSVHELKYEVLQQGYLVSVWKESPKTVAALEEYPELKFIYQLAASVGCQYVRFDTDGPLLGDLPIW